MNSINISYNTHNTAYKKLTILTLHTTGLLLLLTITYSTNITWKRKHIIYSIYSTNKAYSTYNYLHYLHYLQLHTILTLLTKLALQEKWSIGLKLWNNWVDFWTIFFKEKKKTNLTCCLFSDGKNRKHGTMIIHYPHFKMDEV